MKYDVAIIGGGIVGLATAYHLTEQYPALSVAVLEKEDRVAAHQSGRNSGVLHSGIYYTPGSLKAVICREGRRRLVDFCDREGVAYDLCGKVIVAVDRAELPRLHAIHERSVQNQIACERIGPEALREREPHAAGVEALYVPDAGIVDFVGVSRRLAALLQERGQAVLTQARVDAVTPSAAGVSLDTARGVVEARYLINCAGLYADRVARMSGQDPAMKIVPFRGEYFDLKPRARHLCRHLIYPVPDPAFPFLGVHFTRMIDGRVVCGPSAVLAFAREGYTFGTVNLRDLAETITYRGFARLGRKHWRTGLAEMRRSLRTSSYVTALQRLVPALCLDDLAPSPAGVRAQALTPEGDLYHDFFITETERVVHVLNAASPAATASLAIGRHIVSRLAARFD